ncbi:MAG: hypothetical protein QXL94_01815 [Candidatus Parvarchaeum sp.]
MPSRQQNIEPYWANEFYSVGGKIDADGTVLLYHGTTKERAQNILREKVLRRPVNTPDSYGVYLSSSPTVGEDYGDGTVVPVRVKVSDLRVDDIFPGRRMDFMVPTKNGVYRPIAVGKEALRSNR